MSSDDGVGPGVNWHLLLSCMSTLNQYLMESQEWALDS
jgi:hypothetical protein